MQDANEPSREAGLEPGLDEVIDETDGLDDVPSGEPSQDAEDRALEDIEYEGKVYQAPKALKDALMRHADYTRKTQELAAERRAFEVQREQDAEAFENRAALASLDQRIAAIETTDWDGLAAQDPERAQGLHQHLAELCAARDNLAGHLASWQAEQWRNEREVHARRVADGLAIVQREIPDWSAELAGRLVSFAANEFGVTREELAGVHDPRLVKLLHAAYVGANSAQMNRQAQRHVDAQASRPAATVSGRAAASKDPNRMSTDEWMRHRNQQVRRAR